MKLRPIEAAVLELFVRQYPVDKTYEEIQQMLLLRDEELPIHTMYEDLEPSTLVFEIENTVDRFDYYTEQEEARARAAEENDS